MQRVKTMIGVMGGFLTVLSFLGAVVAWVNKPEILQFEGDPPEVVVGERTTLVWNTKNADVVLLEGLGAQPKQVAASGRQMFRITETNLPFGFRGAR